MKNQRGVVQINLWIISGRPRGQKYREQGVGVRPGVPRNQVEHGPADAAVAPSLRPPRAAPVFSPASALLRPANFLLRLRRASTPPQQKCEGLTNPKLRKKFLLQALASIRAEPNLANTLTDPPRHDGVPVSHKGMTGRALGLLGSAG